MGKTTGEDASETLALLLGLSGTLRPDGFIGEDHGEDASETLALLLGLSGTLRPDGSNLAIHFHDGKTIIYYVARYLPLSEDRIHCMVQESDGTWHTNSPSYEAIGTGSPMSTQTKPDPVASVAVSPDGKIIAYFGVDHCVHLYFNIDDVAYSYRANALSYDIKTWGSNSLQFFDNNTIYYLCSIISHLPPPIVGIHDFKYQNNYCANTQIGAYET